MEIKNLEWGSANLFFFAVWPETNYLGGILLPFLFINPLTLKKTTHSSLAIQRTGYGAGFGLQATVCPHDLKILENQSMTWLYIIIYHF